MDDNKELDLASARAADYLSVTRDEAEALIRRVSKVCKGNYKSEKHKAEYAELRAKSGGFVQREGYSISALDALNRNYCGYDVNEIVLQFPFDGEEHIAHCPKCGQEISFRSPIFVLEG